MTVSFVPRSSDLTDSAMAAFGLLSGHAVADWKGFAPYDVFAVLLALRPPESVLVLLEPTADQAAFLSCHAAWTLAATSGGLKALRPLADSGWNPYPLGRGRWVWSSLWLF